MTEQANHVTLQILSARTVVSGWGVLDSTCYAVFAGHEPIHKGLDVRFALAEARRVALERSIMIQILPGLVRTANKPDLCISTPGDAPMFLSPWHEGTEKLINGTSEPFQPLTVILNKAVGELATIGAGTTTTEGELLAKAVPPPDDEERHVIVGGRDGKLYSVELSYVLKETTMEELGLCGVSCQLCGLIMVYPDQLRGFIAAGDRIEHLRAHHPEVADGISPDGPGHPFEVIP